MKKFDLERTMVEITVDRALRELAADPERVLRRLIDMGHTVSNGRFQRRFFHQAQVLLENPGSAYYRLMRQAAREISHDHLKTFGINLGYHGCTRGAQQIREQEAALGFNIPWTISFRIGEVSAIPEMTERVIQEGKTLGIYVYQLFFRADRVAEYLPLLARHKDCAFLLYLEPQWIREPLVDRLAALRHVMVSLDAGRETDGAVQLLRQRKMLYAMHRFYRKDEAKQVPQDAELIHIAARRPMFFILIADHNSPETEQQVGQRVDLLRAAQTHPLLLIHLQSDLLAIDQVISDDACALLFDESGYACQSVSAEHPTQYRMNDQSLSQLLRILYPKKP